MNDLLLKNLSFAEATSYLYSLGHETLTINFDLGTTREILRRLGDPAKNYLKVQLAGTNGKGSVGVFLEAICRAACVPTGLYTSPDILSILERIRVGGSQISEATFAKHATRVRVISEELVAAGLLKITPTFFEQVTCIALAAFHELKIEVGILETGLGGRLDATTATSAEIVAITAIDVDHQAYLGETLTDIAREKAAVITSDTRVIVSHQRFEPMRVIEAKCREVGVVPRLADSIVTTVDHCGRISFHTEKDRYAAVKLGLLGRHQIENAKSAILLAEALQNRFRITNANIVMGLESARHAGRLEFDRGFLFDGAHNVGGARALRDFLDESVKQPITLVFGAMNDKNVKAMAEVLFPAVERLVLTRPNNLRSFSAAELSELVPATVDPRSVVVTENVREAIAKARDMTDADGLILIAGSLYLIGEVKRLLRDTPEFEI